MKSKLNIAAGLNLVLSARQFLFLLLLTVIGVGLASEAHAQAPKMCVPAAIGVPGDPTPPNWWDGTGQNPNGGFKSPLDPRWRGAMSLDFGFGTGTHSTDSDAEFRVLSNMQGNQKYLLLSWFIKSPPDIDVDQTSLFVGLAPNQTNAAGTIIKLTLHQDS